MKNFEHQVWAVNVKGVISRLAGFNTDQIACDFRASIAKEHPTTTVLVVISGGEITSSSVGRGLEKGV